MAFAIGDDNFLGTFSTGYEAANEIYYHTQCLLNFHNEFNKAQKQQSQTSLSKMSQTTSKFQL